MVLGLLALCPAWEVFQSRHVDLLESLGFAAVASAASPVAQVHVGNKSLLPANGISDGLFWCAVLAVHSFLCRVVFVCHLAAVVELTLCPFLSQEIHLVGEVECRQRELSLRIVTQRTSKKERTVCGVNHWD